MLLKHFIAIATLLACSSALAAEGDAGHGSLEFGLGFYHNSDGQDGADGNPFLDEASTVIEPIALFTYNLSDKSTAWVSPSFDYVSSASIERLSNFPQQSGASGDYYFGLEGGYSRELESGNEWGVFGSGSVEYDYISVGGGADYTINFDGGHSLKTGLNAFYDMIDVIRFDGTPEDTETRLSLSGKLDAYQIINPLTHAEYGAVVTLQDGFLETAYNSVVIEDTDVPNPNLVGNAPGREVTEELDDSRIRMALYGRVRRSLTDSCAVELGGRIYNDTWGITGYAVEPRWYQWLVLDRLRLRMRYRYYQQTEADDYAEQFTTEPEFRTQDSDLADFSAHSLGVLLSVYRDSGSRFDLGADYIMRDDNLDDILVRTSYKWEF